MLALMENHVKDNIKIIMKQVIINYKVFRKEFISDDNLEPWCENLSDHFTHGLKKVVHPISKVLQWLGR